MPDRAPTTVLAYQPPASGARRPRLLGATLFALPGLLCWLLLLANVVGYRLLAWFPSIPYPVYRAIRAPLVVLVPMWGIAVVAAIASVIRYWNAPKPWFVVLCLVANAVGLAFSVLAVFFFLAVLTR